PLCLRPVDDERPGGRPRCLTDLAAPARPSEQDLRPLVADRAGDPARKVEHSGWIRIAAVEDAAGALRDREAHEFADVLRRRRVKDALAAVAEHDDRPAVERPLDEEPLPPKPVAASVHGARADGGGGDARVLEEREL